MAQKSFQLITDDKRDAPLSLKLLELAIYKCQTGAIIIIMLIIKSGIIFSVGGERGAFINKK